MNRLGSRWSRRRSSLRPLLVGAIRRWLFICSIPSPDSRITNITNFSMLVLSVGQFFHALWIRAVMHGSEKLSINADTSLAWRITCIRLLSFGQKTRRGFFQGGHIKFSLSYFLTSLGELRGLQNETDIVVFITPGTP